VAKRRSNIRDTLQGLMVIPACPLALTAGRRLDERRQRALVRYYQAANATGLAVGVHTTQFAIRDPQVGLFGPVLELVAEELNRVNRPFLRIAGACGSTHQAVTEAELARRFGYDAVLLNLGVMKNATDEELITHCRHVANILPLVGFYLQPAVGGRVLRYHFWRRFAEIDNVVAIKVAPFNRYQTLDVVRAIAESGRNDIALWTGNDDAILTDLLTPYRFAVARGTVERRFTGGLLGQWAVWTRRAAQLAEQCYLLAALGTPVPAELLRTAAELTDANAAIFDAANGFAGCIAGIHEVLRRQGLFEGVWCLDPMEQLSPGQAEEIDRVCRAYPHLTDDEFVRENLSDWLSG
jgi:dihydrodipicolinate synthase/N-acetylneuraminate lyase